MTNSTKRIHRMLTIRAWPVSNEGTEMMLAWLAEYVRWDPNSEYRLLIRNDSSIDFRHQTVGMV